MNHRCPRSAPSSRECRLLEDPRFLTRHDRIGWTVLHRSVRSVRPKGDVLAYLVQKRPASIRIQSRDGHRALPLHLYLSGKSYGRNLEVTRVLVDTYPEALMEPAEDGSLPLHLAVQIHTYVEPLPRAVVPFLVRSRPAALRVQDKAGRLPIRCLWLCEGPTWPYPRSGISWSGSRRRSSRRTATASSRFTVPSRAGSTGRCATAPSSTTWPPRAPNRSTYGCPMGSRCSTSWCGRRRSGGAWKRSGTSPT
jgi:hypothetical protein